MARRKIPAPGARVRATGLMDDPDPIPVGNTGTVRWATEHQIKVDWDEGDRALMLLPTDPFEVLPADHTPGRTAS